MSIGSVWRNQQACDELVEIIYQTIKPDERDGDRALFSSGYGSGPIVINMRELAEAILLRRAEFWGE